MVLPPSQKNNAEDLLQAVIQEEERSKNFGFYWDSIDQVFEQIKSECDEIREAYLKKDFDHCKEEVGDLIHAAISLSFFAGFDPKEALEISFEKYKKRLNRVIDLVKEDGLDNLKNQPMETLLNYWKKAKLGLDL